jgi:hypothetical protein
MPILPRTLPHFGHGEDKNFPSFCFPSGDLRYGSNRAKNQKNIPITITFSPSTLSVISSPPLTRKTILPFRILKRSSDRSAKTLRCTQSPCASLIVGFPFPFARPRAGRFHRNFLRRSGARPARTLRCSRCPCAPRIAELVSILRYSAQMEQRLIDLVPRFEKGTSICLASQLTVLVHYRGATRTMRNRRGKLDEGTILAKAGRLSAQATDASRSDASQTASTQRRTAAPNA